jgi:methylenetetrahydrofolate--tRNA-(uracil-5-)-methyltransferase
LGRACAPPPATTALGALLGHITGGHLLVEEYPTAASDPEGPAQARSRSFQPMNVNFGLLPPIEAAERDATGKRRKGKDKAHAKKREVALRALTDVERWLSAEQGGQAAAE